MNVPQWAAQGHQSVKQAEKLRHSPWGVAVAE